MRDVERNNLAEIQALNQRGGRTLSFVDLMEAGTLNPEIVGFMLCSIAQGGSVLMGAGVSGAGKSTVLANVLCLLPPGERIVLARSASVVESALRRPPTQPECYLAHEIGEGRWRGYIWGITVRNFFRLMDSNRRIASCLHADTLEQTEQMLRAEPLLVDPQLLARLDLVGFVSFADGASGKRRLTHLYARAPGIGLALAFRWRASDETHDRASELEIFGIDRSRFYNATAFAHSLLDENVRTIEDLRAHVVEFYQREGW